MRSMRCGLATGGRGITCLGSVIACSLGIIPTIRVAHVSPFQLNCSIFERQN